MSSPMAKSVPDRLGVGFVGSGFNARFHMQGFQAVRDAEVRGVWSPNAEHARSAAALARQLDIGADYEYTTGPVSERGLMKKLARSRAGRSSDGAAISIRVNPIEMSK